MREVERRWKGYFEMKRYLVAIVVAGLVWLGGDSTLAAAEPSDDALTPVYFQRIQIDGFWKEQFKRLTEKWIPHCVRQMEAGGEGEELLNLVNTAKVLKGEPTGKFTGTPWADAYVYNTIEAICLALAVDAEDDPDLAAAQQFLRKKLDEWIPVVLAGQMDDGYIHSYHTVNKFDRYTNINAHEFYVQGYLIEAGVAHYRITGGEDVRLYGAACKCADQLCENFGPAPKRNWIYGHAGMGIALCRLARLVNEVEGEPAGDKYSDLAKFFFDHRHDEEEHRNAYRQSHLPAVEQSEAVGHAVRATYFYSAMAELAMLTGDTAYQTAVDRIWESAVHRRMYVTGGVGSTGHGEAFGEDYQLPNESAYCESCAGCGLSFWADRMNRMHHDGAYVDVQERVLYNNVLGAIELSGERFFYQNPLASALGRRSWHGCPCCVGNIPRTLIAIKDLMYSVNETRDTLYVNHFVASSGTIGDVGGTKLGIRQETEYPWQGHVSLILTPDVPTEFAVEVRIPNRWQSHLYDPPSVGFGSIKTQMRVNGDLWSDPLDGGGYDSGYFRLVRTWKPGDRIDFILPMPNQRVYADKRVESDRGRVALQRGPIVYNIENIDHDGDVRSIFVPEDAELKAEWKEDLLGGVMVLKGQAKRTTPGGIEAVDLVAVPNYARLNRGGWSQVWIAENADMSVQWLEPAKGVYRIAALHTKKPWGIVAGSPEEGAVVQQEPVSDATSQLWRIEKAEAAYHKLINVKSGLALTVSDGKRGNNALMCQAKYDGKDYQHFAFERREGGVIVMVARHSGRSICVQVASRRDGAPIHQYDYVGVLDQQIELTKLE
jgi:uncharacterized protein